MILRYTSQFTALILVIQLFQLTYHPESSSHSPAAESHLTMMAGKNTGEPPVDLKTAKKGAALRLNQLEKTITGANVLLQVDLDDKDINLQAHYRQVMRYKEKLSDNYNNYAEKMDILSKSIAALELSDPDQWEAESKVFSPLVDKQLSFELDTDNMLCELNTTLILAQEKIDGNNLLQVKINAAEKKVNFQIEKEREELALKKARQTHEHKENLQKIEADKIRAANPPPPPPQPITPVVQPTNNPHIKVRLPKGELPKFSGEEVKWHPFWARFEEEVDSRTDMSDATKLDYLTMCLEGDALEMIVNLPIIGPNYKVACDILKAEFHSTTKIAELHYKGLNKIPKLSENSPFRELQAAQRTVEANLMALEALKCDIENQPTLYLIMSIFPSSFGEFSYMREPNEAVRDTVRYTRTALREYIKMKKHGRKPSAETTQVTSMLTNTHQPQQNHPPQQNQHSNHSNRRNTHPPNQQSSNPA